MLHLLIALQTAVQLPPPPRGYGTSTAEVVVDAANVMPPSSVDRINRIAFDVHQKSRGEIAVVTLPDIGLRAPVVILLVPKETSSSGRGECFITTGQGTEGFILDAEAAALCREAIPLFQQQQYGPALEYLTGRVAEEFAREFNFALDSLSSPRISRPEFDQPRGRSTGGLSPIAIFVLFMVAYFILSSFGRRRRGCGGCIPIPIVFPTGGGYHRGGWGGGGFGGGLGGGGGFGGFGGGGGFSGGGGGSSW